MKPSDHIQDVAQWEANCREIRARAVELIEGRIGIIDAARALSKLAQWTGLTNDDDLTTFIAIDSETDTLPVGEVRQYWSVEALGREDPEICDAEDLYRQTALGAAARLADRFAWALDVTNKRRTPNVG